MNDSIYTMLDEIKRLTNDVFAQDKYHAPLFVLNLKDKGISSMPLEFKDAEDKDRIFKAIKSMITVGDLIEYVFIAESWILETKNHSSIREVYDNYKSLANHPERKEVLFLQYSSVNKEEIYCASINRNPDNKDDVNLGNWEVMDNKKEKNVLPSGGRLNNMFEKAKSDLN